MVYHNKQAWKIRQSARQILRAIFKMLWKLELQQRGKKKKKAPWHVFAIHIPSISECKVYLENWKVWSRK